MYLYVKALHVFAVVILIGGMLAMALALRIAMAASDEREARRFGDAVLRWDGFVTTPALAVVWMAGLHNGLWCGLVYFALAAAKNDPGHLPERSTAALKAWP